MRCLLNHHPPSTIHHSPSATILMKILCCTYIILLAMLLHKRKSYIFNISTTYTSSDDAFVFIFCICIDGCYILCSRVSFSALFRFEFDWLFVPYRKEENKYVKLNIICILYLYFVLMAIFYVQGYNFLLCLDLN